MRLTKRCKVHSWELLNSDDECSMCRASLDVERFNRAYWAAIHTQCHFLLSNRLESRRKMSKTFKFCADAECIHHTKDGYDYCMAHLALQRRHARKQARMLLEST